MFLKNFYMVFCIQSKIGSKATHISIALLPDRGGVATKQRPQ